jgi:hypothetical protein
MAKTKPVAREQSRSKRVNEHAAADNGQNGDDQELAKFEQDLAEYLQQRIKPGLNSGAVPLLARSIAKDLAHRSAFNSPSEDAEGEEEEPDAEAEEEPTSEADDEAEDDESDTEEDDEPRAEAEDDESDTEDDDEPRAEAEDDESDTEDDDEPSAEAEDDESDTEEDDEPLDFEDEMHQLQSELGEDWILRFSVQGDDAWLTAEKDDGSQRIEAPSAEVLTEAVGLLNDGGGRST